MRIEYEKEAAKHIGKMDRPTKQRLKIAIEKLPAGDVKKLQGIKDLECWFGLFRKIKHCRMK